MPDACTIACKSEHQIPIGVNRCWVKTVEKGTFPDTRRFFFPVLCNQRDEAPCARICPTGALFKRRDGIVDLHGDSCIGCRACMVACPYDQLFIDPNTHTAEKCNFCANRVENRLEPACVSVCPTQCRIFGDLDDPTSEVGIIARSQAIELTPLAYMRKYGAFRVKDRVYTLHAQPLPEETLAGATLDRDREIVTKDGRTIGVLVDGTSCAGFNTPSRRLEFYSATLAASGWPEHGVPRYVPSHVSEGIRPGVVGMSHHLGRWRLHEELGNSRAASSLVTIEREGESGYRFRQVHGVRPYESGDPDTQRIWWTEVGVHQNLTFPVQPDPVSGMHCWHQRVHVEKAGADDHYGDIFVDTAKSHEAYKEWLTMTRPAPGPDGLRRPLWFDRPLRPKEEAYKIDS